MGRRYEGPRPDRSNALDPRIREAARAVSKQLTERGYAHALIGGLAVNHYGYKRTTSDVDFLVSGDAEGDLTGDALGGSVRGKSIRRGRIDVDLLFPNHGEEFLEPAIRGARGGAILISALVYLKLSAGRMKDTADVIELLKRGKIDVKSTRAYLTSHAKWLVDDFDSLVIQAKYEKD